jgi:hypothetical protein
MSDSVTPSSRGRTLKAAAPLIAGALVLGACSKTADPVNNAATGNTTASSVTANTGGSSNGTGNNTGTTQASGKSLNTKVYADGFTYDLGGVAYNQSSGQLTIATTITNNGTESATPYTDLSLLSGDSSVSSSGSLTDRKEIVGGKNVKDTMTFSVDANFNPANTTLVFNAEDKVQAKVPLSGTGTAVTLAPVVQADQLTAPITIGTVTFTPTSLEIRYDDPAGHTSAKQGKAFVVAYGGAKNASTDNTIYWDTSGMQLTSPDAQTYVADSATPSSLGPTKSADTVIVWTIDDPNPGQLSGDYKLDIKDQNMGADSSQGKVTVPTITLTLSDKPVSGGSGGTTGTTQKKGTTTTSSGG